MGKRYSIMELRISSIPLMLECVSHSGTAAAKEARFRTILGHADYQFEARRYGLASVEPLVSYFARLKSIRPEEIPALSDERKNALREKHAQWLDCASHPQKYLARYEKVQQALCAENIQALQRRLSAAFLHDIALDDAGLLSTLSFGPSFGYVYENALHLDLFGIEEICTMEELPCMILHEMHHLQIQKLMGSYRAFTAHFSPLEHYLFRFTGEGMAIKFCNNAEGVVSKRIDAHSPANIGIPAIPVLNRHFEEHFRLFNHTVQQLNRNAITAEEINEQFQSYWWNPYLYQDEITFLPQTPLYSFGNELFGCIFDAFGLNTLFECFCHPSKTIEYFNRANCGYVISAR